jgi:hypothetical protein
VNHTANIRSVSVNSASVRVPNQLGPARGRSLAAAEMLW